MAGEAKWKRYEDAVAILKARGIKYESLNNNLEFVFADGTQYWPTTGTIMQEGKRLDVKGIEALIEILV